MKYRWGQKVYEGVFMKAMTWQVPDGAIRVKMNETIDFVQTTSLDTTVPIQDMSGGMTTLETDFCTAVDSRSNASNFADIAPHMLSIGFGSQQGQPATPLPLQDGNKSEPVQTCFVL